MKKYTILLILMLGLPLIIKAQDSIPALKDVIVGRWIESKRIIGENVKDITGYPDTYIFKDNMVFHKGEAAEGVILFNIAGRYEVEGDIVEIYYRDYIQKNASKQETMKLCFKVLSLSENEMQVLVQDCDYEYGMVLNK